MERQDQTSEQLSTIWLVLMLKMKETKRNSLKAY